MHAGCIAQSATLHSGSCVSAACLKDITHSDTALDSLDMGRRHPKHGQHACHPHCFLLFILCLYSIWEIRKYRSKGTGLRMNGARSRQAKGLCTNKYSQLLARHIYLAIEGQIVAKKTQAPIKTADACRESTVPPASNMKARYMMQASQPHGPEAEDNLSPCHACSIVS